MATIHDEIDNYLAADLHNELSADERSALHTHLVECADCRKLHLETKIMHKVLEENLANEKPDLAFEQRMLSGFRNRIPQKSRGLMTIITDLMRLRATQLTAVAALLLALVQVGRMVTGERGAGLPGVREEAHATSFRIKNKAYKIAPPSAPRAGTPDQAYVLADRAESDDKDQLNAQVLGGGSLARNEAKSDQFRTRLRRLLRTKGERPGPRRKPRWNLRRKAGPTSRPRLPPIKARICNSVAGFSGFESQTDSERNR